MWGGDGASQCLVQGLHTQLVQQRLVPGHRKLPRNILSGYSNAGSGFLSKSRWTKLLTQVPWAWQLGAIGKELSLCEMTQKEATAPLSTQTCLNILW